MTLFPSRPARTALLAAAVSLGSLAAAAQTPPFTAEQRGAIGEIIREYLLQNPEVLQEAIAELEKRQGEAQKSTQVAALGEERERLFNSPRGFVVGNPAGDVALLEFFDYNCGYCKRALVKADPKLKLVLRDFPVLGPESVEASRVSIAAKQQLKGEKLFEYHARVMETKGRVDGERAMAVAREMGLDMARLQKDLEGEEVKATLQENVALGDKLGLTGTPAFILADEIIPGAVGLEPMRQAVASVRQCGKVSCG
jgi:protein-disulfide isomerase